MSIHTDFRQVSDDIWEYSEWLNEMKREYRKEEYEKEDAERDECFSDSDENSDNNA